MPNSVPNGAPWTADTGLQAQRRKCLRPSVFGAFTNGPAKNMVAVLSLCSAQKVIGVFKSVIDEKLGRQRVRSDALVSELMLEGIRSAGETRRY